MIGAGTSCCFPKHSAAAHPFRRGTGRDFDLGRILNDRANLKFPPLGQAPQCEQSAMLDLVQRITAADALKWGSNMVRGRTARDEAALVTGVAGGARPDLCRRLSCLGSLLHHRHSNDAANA